MSYFLGNYKFSLLERLAHRALQLGPMPEHIAFIMDGNRRFARREGQETIWGHRKGFLEILPCVLDWCQTLGVRQVTTYFFSVQNFKRTSGEVEGLMQMFTEIFDRFVREVEHFRKRGVCVRICGKPDLLPLHIQKSISTVVSETSQCTKFYFNICIAYTGRMEIESAYSTLQDCVKSGLIEESDIDESTLACAMNSLGLQNPDIMIRTSGEIRLSDFLPFNIPFTHTAFVKEYWPEFRIWSLFKVIFQFQCESVKIADSHRKHLGFLQKRDLELCKREFLAKHSTKTTFDEFMNQRGQRISNCCEYIKQKRNQMFENVLNSAQEEQQQVILIETVNN